MCAHSPSLIKRFLLQQIKDIYFRSGEYICLILRFHHFYVLLARRRILLTVLFLNLMESVIGGAGDIPLSPTGKLKIGPWKITSPTVEYTTYWRRRWFVLKQVKHFWFLNGVSRFSVPRAAIPVGRCITIKDAKDDIRRPNAFKISTGVGSYPLYFIADSGERISFADSVHDAETEEGEVDSGD